jgi:hypothetical protein
MIATDIVGVFLSYFSVPEELISTTCRIKTSLRLIYIITQPTSSGDTVLGFCLGGEVFHCQ